MGGGRRADGGGVLAGYGSVELPTLRKHALPVTPPAAAAARLINARGDRSAAAGVVRPSRTAEPVKQNVEFSASPAELPQLPMELPRRLEMQRPRLARPRKRPKPPRVTRNENCQIELKK